MRAHLPWSLAALALLAPAGAWAARPMVTDDARIVDPKACQLETWTRRGRDATKHWALPSCNPTGRFELTLGGGRLRDPDGERTLDRQVQAKTLLRPLEANGWGFALAAGAVGHSDARRDLYAYLPASRSLQDDRLVLHFNGGLLRDGAAHRTRWTWGLAAEVQLAPRTWLVAERFGPGEGRPFHHAGVRHWLVENRLQVDLTAGQRQGGGQERWVSLGLRVLTPAFLP